MAATLIQSSMSFLMESNHEPLKACQHFLGHALKDQFQNIRQKGVWNSQFLDVNYRDLQLFFLNFFVPACLWDHCLGFPQELIILSQSIYELSDGKVKQWSYPILPKRWVPMWREWIEFFKYLSFSSQISAVFNLLHMENCSDSPCTHPQDLVGAQI